MKITARLTGTAALARVDAVRLPIVQRLTAAIERELQSTTLAAADARQRVASPSRGEVGTPRT